ncbi:MAG: lysostaphin resistance A-like protein [Capsulimonadaceae bacterium]
MTLILAFVATHIVSAVRSPGLPTTGKHPISARADFSTEATLDLIGTDLEAKQAFLVAIVTGSPDWRTLTDARDDAARLDDDSGNAPSAAGRLIILRALLDEPPLARTPHGHLPLNAFGPDLPAGTVARDRRDIAAEGKFFASVFVKTRLTRSQAALAVASARPLSGRLRWWYHPLLAAIHQRSDDLQGAKRSRQMCGRYALWPTLLADSLMLVRFAMLIAGLFLLVGLGLRAVDAAESFGSSSRSAAWPPENAPHTPATPAPAAVGSPRLSTVDLWTVFLLYLVGSELFAMALGGYDGIGPHHWLHFAGAVHPFLKRLDNSSAQIRVTAIVMIDSVAYVFGAAPAILWLWRLARLRGTTLAEVGLTLRGGGMEIVHGLGGYCIATPLILAAPMFLPHFFSKFPSPSNPVIPMLVSVTGPMALVLLLVASVAAPFIEEIVFRGALYQALRREIGPWPAILLSGFIFGFIHPVGVAEMVPLAVLGCVFAWLAETRRSLVPSMVAHCINNLTTSLLLLCVVQS